MDPVKVIYEDKDFIAINKPAGMLAHSPGRNDRDNNNDDENRKEVTVADWAARNYPEVKIVGDQPETRPGIVHRLDRGTSGALVIARTQKYFEYLKKLFGESKIKKTYLALVCGKAEWRRGVIDKPIYIRNGTTKRSVYKGRMEKEAVTEYELVKSYKFESYGRRKEEWFSLLRVTPRTGRTHQIRVHLASIGHPVAGDAMYGTKQTPLGLARQFLHAESIEWSAEDGHRIRIEAELPEDLRKALDKLVIGNKFP